MSSKRLVVLDEQDYKSLLDQAKCPRSKSSSTETQLSTDLVDKPDTLDYPSQREPVSRKSEEKETSQPLLREPEDFGTKETEKTSDEDDLLKSVPQVAHSEAKKLLQQLDKLESFDYDSATGEIKLDGVPLQKYDIFKLLAATSRKSAPNDLPVPLRLFLWRNKITKFRNRSIRLRPTEEWRSMFGSGDSTTE